MIHYILQMVVFQLVFLVIYDVFLRKETFFNHNRAYVLITSVLAFVLPFVKIQALESVFSNTLLVRLPEVVLNDNNFKNNTALASNDLLASTNFNWWSLIYVGVFIAFVFFLYRSFKLYKTIKSNSLENKTDYKIIHLNNSNGAYSFFNYIFLGDLIQNEERQSVLTHEKVHVKEKHSIDLLWFELLKITFWFNPLIYVYQHRVKEIHEFIADSKSNKKHSESYQNVLLNQLFQIKNLSFVNPFYKKSLIKNRLIMLSKSKSDRIKLTKYLLIIPMVLGMLLFSSYKEEVKNDDVAEGFQASQNIAIREVTVSNQVVPKKESDQLIKSGVIKSDKIIKIIAKDTVDVEVPFSVVDHVPIFENCKGLQTEALKKKCFIETISKYVGVNFNRKLADSLKLKGEIKMMAVFKVNKKGGKLTDIRVRAPHEVLEKEVIRVIKTLPKMEPGKHDGKYVTIPYALPIKFKIQE